MPKGIKGFQKGNQLGKSNIGKIRSEAMKMQISKANKGRLIGEKNPCFGRTGEKNPNYGKSEEESVSWKGDSAGISAMHLWVERQKGKAKKHVCKHCGKQAKHWANKKHDYKRLLDDYIALCCKCHKKYDKENNKK